MLRTGDSGYEPRFHDLASNIFPPVLLVTLPFGSITVTCAANSHRPGCERSVHRPLCPPSQFQSCCCGIVHSGVAEMLPSDETSACSWMASEATDGPLAEAKAAQNEGSAFEGLEKGKRETNANCKTITARNTNAPSFAHSIANPKRGAREDMFSASVRRCALLNTRDG